MVCVVLAFFDKISIAVLFSDPHFQSSMGIAEDKAKLGWGVKTLTLLVGQPTQQGIPLQLHQIVINGYTVLTLISGLLSKISSIKKTTQSAWFFI
ncbi:permease [Acinetobacter baumannii]|nr:permease [Acinetobacter baumannii]